MSTQSSIKVNLHHWKPYLLIAPSLVLIGVFIFYPLMEGISLSFTNQDIQNFNTFKFVGFKNYIKIFNDGDFWFAFRQTFLWMVSCVCGAYVVGFGLALLLQNLKWGGLFRAFLLIPWIFANVVIGVLWKWLFHDQFGFINLLLLKMGLISHPIQWLSNGVLAMICLVYVYIWKISPFILVTLSAGLQAIPKELYEAALIDGVSPLQNFRYITFPLMRSASIVVVILMSIWAFNQFDLIYILTGGGPGNATTVLSLLVYFKAFYRMTMGQATTIGVIMLLALTILGSIYYHFYREVEMD